MRGAWKSKGTSQRELVKQLQKAGIIRTDAVANIMGLVDRGNYCFLRPEAKTETELESDHLCYADRALPIGLGQTISAPHMHACALEEIYPSVAKAMAMVKSKTSNNADVNINTKILDVGCGSGYLTACFGRWMSMSMSMSKNSKCSGKVFGIDVREDLVEMTRSHLEREDGDLLSTGVVDLSLRDGWKGLPEHAPFDAIHVGAAAETLPKLLAHQLTVGGVLVVPIGPREGSKPQILYKIRRIRGSGREIGSGSGSTSDSGTDSMSGNELEEYYSSEDSFCEQDFEVTPLVGVRYVPLVRGEEL